jgi:hypothetical protein
MNVCCTTENGVKCEDEATWAITVSCAHEHIDVDASCTPHRYKTERLADSMICKACEDGPQSHECRAYLAFDRFGGGEGRGPKGDE